MIKFLYSVKPTHYYYNYHYYLRQKNIEIHVCSRNQDIYIRSRAQANTEHDNKQQRHCDEINGISRKGISNFTLTEWKLDCTFNIFKCLPLRVFSPT